MIDRSPFTSPFTDSRVSMLMMKSITQQQHGGALLYLILLASRNDHRASDTRCGVSRKPGGSPWVPRGDPSGLPQGDPHGFPVGGSPRVPHFRVIPSESRPESYRKFMTRSVVRKVNVSLGDVSRLEAWMPRHRTARFARVPGHQEHPLLSNTSDSRLKF